MDGVVVAPELAVIQTMVGAAEDRRYAALIRPGLVLSAGRQLGMSLLQGKPGLIDVAYLSAWTLEVDSWRLAAWHATRYAPTR